MVDTGVLLVIAVLGVTWPFLVALAGFGPATS